MDFRKEDKVSDLKYYGKLVATYTQIKSILGDPEFSYFNKRVNSNITCKWQSKFHDGLIVVNDKKDSEEDNITFLGEQEWEVRATSDLVLDEFLAKSYFAANPIFIPNGLTITPAN